MSALSVIFGMVVGFSLGLTGGGGAVFAVPLLVYGLNLPSRDAVGVSLVTVGTTALVALVQRARHRMVEFPTGLLFAFAGMLAAPVGAWLSRQISETLLLVMFGGLMLAVAGRMWFKAARQEPSTACVPLDDGPACQRDAQGQLRLTSRCAVLLGAIGLVTGVLTGMFGVGGGFLIVPSLVAFSGMEMNRAIGTSLLVIALVSMSSIASHFLVGGSAPAGVTLLFLMGSLTGLFAGTAIGRRIAGARLQQVFAVAILALGVFVIFSNFWS